MTVQIDWNFIAQQEGSKLNGYVPDPYHSHSGVTIASGVDLGQMTAAEIVAAYPPALAVKLTRYAGLHGSVAQAALERTPLTITQDEANLLNQRARAVTVAGLERQYLVATGKTLDSLPPAAQTILASVTFQYGTPWVRTPNFWHACLDRNWALVIADLRNFHDAYQPRHSREADYLEQHLHA